MNCKPGDLAIRVSAPQGASIGVGAVVRCIGFVGEGRVFLGFTDQQRLIRDGWSVEYRGSDGIECGVLWTVPDCDLRLIRDAGGEDEMLTLLGKPETVTA